MNNTEFETLRLSLGLSQSQMAEALGVSQQVYSNIENGRTKKITAEVYRRVMELRTQNGTTNKVVKLDAPEDKRENSSVMSDMAQSNKALAESINKINDTTMRLSITNSNLVEIVNRLTLAANSNVQQNVSQLLLPSIQKIADSLIGKHWDSTEEGMKMLSSVLFDNTQETH